MRQSHCAPTKILIREPRIGGPGDPKSSKLRWALNWDRLYSGLGGMDGGYGFLVLPPEE